MHGATLAAAYACTLTKKLCHQWRETDALAYRMSMRTVIACHVIIVANGHTRANNLAFLTD